MKKNFHSPLFSLLLASLVLTSCGYHNDPPENKSYVVFDVPGSVPGGHVYEREAYMEFVDIHYNTLPDGPVTQVIINLGRSDYVVNNAQVFSQSPPENTVRTQDLQLKDVPLCALTDPRVGAVYGYKFLKADGTVVLSHSFVNTKQRNIC